MPQITTAQRTEEWFAARLGKITASTAAACLNLHRYKTSKAAWREATGCKTEAEERIGVEGTPAWFGTQFEPAARLAYEAHTGHWVDETGFWVSDRHPWLGSSPDGLIGDDGCLEIKVPELCSRQCACYYRIQCLIHMIVLDRRWCDFVQYGWRTQELYIETIYPLSPTGEAALLKRLKCWHEQYVVGGEEPPRKKARRRMSETPF